MDLKIESVQLVFPENANIILGQSHFIKTVEDLHEAMVNTNPRALFGIGFSEASGACEIRTSGTSPMLIDCAAQNLLALGCGHVFMIVVEESFPINYLLRIKTVPEVVNIFCATANAVSVIVARNSRGGGVLGIIDGEAPKGIENEDGKKWRHDFLRKIGYKF